MKKILITSLLLSLLVLPTVSLGVPVTPPETPPEITSPQELLDIIGRIVNWLFAFLIAVAAIFILIAAYQFLTSGGDPTRAAAARTNILYAIVGIIVGIVAKGAVAIVRAITGT